MFCSNCGKQIADGSAFCDQCGAAQAPQAPVQQPAPQPAAPTPQPAAPTPQPAAPTPQPAAPVQQPYIPVQQTYIPVQQAYIPVQQAYAQPAAPVAAPKGKLKLPVPALVALISAVVLLLSVFLPYMVANKAYSDMIGDYGNEIAIPGTDLTAKDLKEVSLSEFASIADALAKVYPSGSGVELVSAMVWILAGCAIAAGLFAFFKKPVGIIIFSVLAYGVSAIFEAGMKESGVLSASIYDYGLAHTLIPLAVLGCIVGAIWLIVEKNKAKKAQVTFVYPQQ